MVEEFVSRGAWIACTGSHLLASDRADDRGGGLEPLSGSAGPARSWPSMASRRWSKRRPIAGVPASRSPVGRHGAGARGRLPHRAACGFNWSTGRASSRPATRSATERRRCGFAIAGSKRKRATSSGSASGPLPPPSILSGRKSSLVRTQGMCWCFVPATRPSISSKALLHDVDTEVVEFELDQQRHPRQTRQVGRDPRTSPPPKGSCRSRSAPFTTSPDRAGRSSRSNSRTMRCTWSLSAATACVLPVSRGRPSRLLVGEHRVLERPGFRTGGMHAVHRVAHPARADPAIVRARRNVSFRGTKLAVGEGNNLRQYDRGLAIHSRSLLVFRLTEDYRRLRRGGRRLPTARLGQPGTGDLR